MKLPLAECGLTTLRMKAKVKTVKEIRAKFFLLSVYPPPTRPKGTPITLRAPRIRREPTPSQEKGEASTHPATPRASRYPGGKKHARTSALRGEGGEAWRKKARLGPKSRVRSGAMQL